MKKPRTIRTKQGAHVARKKSRGVCADCPRRCTGYRCPACKARVRARQRRLMADRRARHLIDPLTSRKLPQYDLDSNL
jgi:hypothetical protein